MRVLVTGHRGRLGGATCAALERDGHEWVGFDRDEGDVRDLAAVTSVARGADAVIHLAGVADDVSDDEVEKVSVNVVGTWVVLLAAETTGIRRFVNLSSGKALGLAEAVAEYLPIDDDHPARPTRAYGLSKLLSDELCEAMTRRNGMVTVCLRPVAVFTPDDYKRWSRFLDGEEETVGSPWHMGAYVDLDDTAEAACLALTRPESGHVRLLLSADDIAANAPSAELAARRNPDVPWLGPSDRPPDAALIDSSAARQILGWQPRSRWSERL